MSRTACSKRSRSFIAQVVAGAALAVSAFAIVPGVSLANPGYLGTGQTLNPGQSVSNTAHQFRLVMQRDCNLVLYNQASRPMWATNTSGQGADCSAIMQRDGNLVVYRPRGAAIWSSRTNGHAGAYGVLQDDGNFVIKPYNGSPFWATGTVYYKLYAPDYLARGMGLFSSNGQYKLINQSSDGNVVVYNQRSGRAVWSTKTVGCGSHFAMQRDGNLVDYSASGRVCWTSNTAGHPGAFLTMQSDGNLVLYWQGKAIWASNTQGK